MHLSIPSISSSTTEFARSTTLNFDSKLLILIIRLDSSTYLRLSVEKTLFTEAKCTHYAFSLFNEAAELFLNLFISNPKSASNKV